MAIKQPHHKLLADLIRQDRITRRSGGLQSLIHKANSHINLEDQITDCLPFQFRDQFTVLDIQNKCLALSCTSAAIATQFRFQMDKTLRLVQQRLGEDSVQQIKIKIRPASKQNKNTEKCHRFMSEKNARLLEEVAGQTGDKALREALERLAKRSDER